MAVNKRETIAKNIARYFHDGDFVNLGVGIPTLSANYIPEGTEIILHAESGFAGQDGAITPPWDVNDREACDRELNNPKWADKENGWKIYGRKAGRFPVFEEIYQPLNGL